MLNVKDLYLSYDDTPVLSIESLQLQEGELGCIIGPSGSGKSSFLNAIAGFLRPQRGSISINDNVVVSDTISTATETRELGMVFQNLCLFPHMTIGQNIAYGLHQKSESETRARVEEMLSLIGLSGFDERYPDELSGGQQQRIAIARALAPAPKLLLLDEPFSSLDPGLRKQLADDLRVLLKQANITALMVTHDQQEAFAVADKIAVFAEQQLQQWDTSYQLYHQPINTTVAKLIGESALIDALVVNSDEQSYISILRSALGDWSLSNEDYDSLSSQSSTNETSNVQVLIRPDDLMFDETSDLRLKVIRREFRGANILYHLAIGNDQSVMSLCPSHVNKLVGEYLPVKLDIKHLIMFPIDSPK